jgi:hypothetical protein
VAEPGGEQSTPGGPVTVGFTLADPKDHGMLAVAGFDASVSAVISNFVWAAQPNVG